MAPRCGTVGPHGEWGTVAADDPPGAGVWPFQALPSPDWAPGAGDKSDTDPPQQVEKGLEVQGVGDEKGQEVEGRKTLGDGGGENLSPLKVVNETPLSEPLVEPVGAGFGDGGPGPQRSLDRGLCRLP